MSASSKKKLRNEQQAAKLTERQLAEQKEAKKLKLYTAAFVIVMVALLAIAVTVGIVNTVNNSGTRERSTVAATIGGHEISNAEMNYFFTDSLNTFYSYYGAYLIDTSLPLDEQANPFGEGTTADYLLDTAIANAQAIYAMADAAEAEGFAMPEDVQESIDATMESLDDVAADNGYTSTKQYLKAMFGNGATEENYRDYIELTMLAQSYYNAYGDSLVYEDADLRAAEAENYGAYSSYTYNYYYLNATNFREGGTEDEEGNITYSDEEIEAGLKAAEETAKALATAGYTSVEELDAAISALEINAESETPVTSTLYEDYLYSSIGATEVADWLAEGDHEEGDIVYLANEATSTDPETNETVTEIVGYYVVYYHGTNENAYTLNDVRHILVAFEGGTTDDAGVTVYSDEEKAMAKTEAELILTEWKNGEATEESFAELANTKSSDGDGTTGGLYEDIGPASSYVENFLNWTIDESRKPGDTDIIETEYGYHVMYFVGDTEHTYRDSLIESELRNTDFNTWYTELVEGTPVVEGDTSYVNTGIVLGY